MHEEQFQQMKRLSADIRIQTIRMIAALGFGHVGGSASIADVLAVLYGGLMRIDPKDPKWEGRDWLVLSKGHCAPALYAALALKGFFPMAWLSTLNRPGTKLPSHADARTVPGIDICTGSLGQGISAATGVSLAHKIKGMDNWTYCIVGDGELNEGQVWEACETASHYKLDHFLCFVDWNKRQLDGRLEEVCDPIDIAKKFTAFGFATQTVRGYDVEAIWKGVQKAKITPGRPHCLILDTYKGIGIHFAETQGNNHHMNFNQEQAEAAIAEIERRYAEGRYPSGEKL